MRVGRGPGGGSALRFRVPGEGSTTFDDIVRGTVTFENAKLEDFVLVRSNGNPTFLLANVVDDADMGITHVVRGEEHVNGTPKYLLIGEALERLQKALPKVAALLEEAAVRAAKSSLKTFLSVRAESFRTNDYYDSEVAWMKLEGNLIEPTIVKQVSKQVAYCRCTRSKNLPFCDGSHASTNITPRILEFDEPTTIAICRCWRSKDHPYCDGTHGRLVKPKPRPKRGGD